MRFEERFFSASAEAPLGFLSAQINRRHNVSRNERYAGSKGLRRFRDGDHSRFRHNRAVMLSPDGRNKPQACGRISSAYDCCLSYSPEVRS